MKIIKMAALALFMMVGSNELHAQKLIDEEKIKVETTELSQKLGLTPAQEKTVGAAALQRVKQQEADKETYKGKKEELKDAHKKSNATFETSVKALLTPDQKAKYEQMLKDKL